MRGDSATLAPQITLREARRRADLTQQQLADRARLDLTTVRNIETDYRGTATHTETAYSLARVLGVEVSAIRWPHGLTDAGHQPHVPFDSRESRAARPTCPKCTFEISLSGDCGC